MLDGFSVSVTICSRDDLDFYYGMRTFVALEGFLFFGYEAIVRLVDGVIGYFFIYYNQD